MASTLDLVDLIPDLQYELNTLGGNEYANVSNEEWEGRLRNGFWTAFNDGFLLDYTEQDGSIVPRSGQTAIPRDLQQLIIMYTSITALRQKIAAMQTAFRAKAGPVEYEVEQSAQVAKALLDDLTARRNYLLMRMADTGVARGVFYIDTYASRQVALNDGLTQWVGN